MCGLVFNVSIRSELKCIGHVPKLKLLLLTRLGKTYDHTEALPVYTTRAAIVTVFPVCCLAGQWRHKQYKRDLSASGAANTALLANSIAGAMVSPDPLTPQVKDELRIERLPAPSFLSPPVWLWPRQGGSVALPVLHPGEKEKNPGDRLACRSFIFTICQIFLFSFLLIFAFCFWYHLSVYRTIYSFRIMENVLCNLNLSKNIIIISNALPLFPF